MIKPKCTVIAVLLGLMLCFALAGCSTSMGIEKPSAATPQSDKIKVVTTIYPLYDFAGNISKGRAEVSYLVPPGSEPHEWEPTPKDLAELQQADVFVYNGAGMENWIDKALQAVGTPELVVVDVSENIELITGFEEEHAENDVEKEAQTGEEPDHDKNSYKEHEHDGKNEQDHDHNSNNAGIDPHIWVDPVNAMKIVENITAGMTKADPTNKEFYAVNAMEYRKKLEVLNEAYKNGLANVKSKEFVTSHAAFGYLAKRYGLVQVPIRGLSPEVEPTPTRMTEVVKMAREKNIHYIFFESLVNPKISQIIADEVGAETLVLNPAAGFTQDELNAGKNYLSVMRENLANLQKALR